MHTYYENWINSLEVQERIKRIVLDPEKLLEGNGNVQGIYEISFVNNKLHVDISAYIGQAGHCPNAPSYVARDVRERLVQHLKRWLGGNYFTYWTGLEEDSDWKIQLHLLREENDYSKRLELESWYIDIRKPFHQDSLDGKFQLYPSKKGYSRNDLCIHPWTREGETAGQRRIAFKHRLHSVLENNRIKG